jgi:MFS family permease
MIEVAASRTVVGRVAHLLDRDRTIAAPGFNRWLVPPAALAIHLCIGMAYGFSVFWLPLSHSLGVTQPITCPDISFVTELFTASCDWRISSLGWMFTLFFVVLGSSAAIWGGWLERVGPRKAAFVSTLCWCGGLLIGALGVMVHQLWLLLLGPGIIGGIGLGLGYISPVSTLIKWFPDRRGMATGLAIMGFGGGAMIGAPLADILIDAFRSPTSVGAWQALIILSAVYLAFMLAGAFGYRLPPTGWRPEGWALKAETGAAMITTRHVHFKNAHKTLQFWLIWLMLCLNISAGIGVIGMASPMLQEIFGGSLVGRPETSFSDLSAVQLGKIAAIGAGFTGLLSLFNITGRLFWAALSDKIGRKATYRTFFVAAILLYAAAPFAAHAGNKALFVTLFCIIVSMYGGAFATVPAYLADIFGTQFVSAIHGRVLTSWSCAGIVGPVLVNYLREYEIAAGVPRDGAYDETMYILAAMLVIALIANEMVRPLAQHWFMTDKEVAELQAGSPIANTGGRGLSDIGGGSFDANAALAWAAVGIPLLWGVWITLESALALFR